MIPARGKYEARFTHDRSVSHRGYSTRTVEAFGDNGEALVVNDKGGLVPATTYENFKEVVEISELVAGVVPGGGWSIAWTDPKTGGTDVDPVVAWIVNSAGNAVPILVDNPTDLMASEYIAEPENVRLVPPSRRASPETAA